MSMDFGCSCCAVPTLVYSCIGVLIVSHLIGKLPLNGKAKIGLKLVSYGAAVIIAVCAILMQMLEKDPELRSWFFAKLCSALSKSAALNEKRCRLLSDAKGVVVEIGLGPGTNFKCWGNETASTMAAGKSIQTYIGVEPNRYFADAIKKEKVRTHLPFQVNILYSSAIQLPDIEDSSVDSVIGTHVLCSIDNVDPVLREIGRILKPGGRYYFLEHVRVKQEGSWQHLAQQMLSPLFRIVGNGCQFKPLWQRFDAHSALLDFKYEEWSAPIPLPFVKPHLIGYATRRGEPGSHLLKKQSANISEGRRNSR